MKTLAQEIGALVMNLRAEEFETTEQFGERIGRVVLEKIAQSTDHENLIRYGFGATLDPSVIARNIVYGVSPCPKCGGPVRDLRGVGFNMSAIEAEGICFLWRQASMSNTFTCLKRGGGR